MEGLTDPRHVRLLEWELTPPAMREPSSQEKLAQELGVSPRTLRDWRDKPEFQAAWRRGFEEQAGSKERVKELLDGLFRDSIDRTLDAAERRGAAKLYWDISRAIAPPEPEPEKRIHAKELSNEELVALLSDAALDELEARGCIVEIRKDA